LFCEFLGEEELETMYDFFSVKCGFPAKVATFAK
jgi:hypothetical protein